MQRQLISRSPDLQRLQDDGYELEIHNGYLLIHHVPYVDANCQRQYGTLVSTLRLSGDVTLPPDTHVVDFIGSAPCDREGHRLDQIIAGEASRQLAPGIEVMFSFSSKPPTGYQDYHAKMTTYVAILLSHAQAIDPDATATTFPVIELTEEESVFYYADTASSRAGITAITQKLALAKVAIVGLGGTGSYILDLVAKTPVVEIHLFDGDLFASHNALRAPGAASVEELRERPLKVNYFTKRYAAMRRGIIPHDRAVSATNVDEFQGMDFVFLALDGGEAKRLLVCKLEEFGVPFIDVGMGIYEVDGALSGVLRVTTSTPTLRDHVWSKERIPFSDGATNNVYSHNIQIADLNALNAALAVIRWKKWCGFYLDPENEHFTTYQVDGNLIANEDVA